MHSITFDRPKRALSPLQRAAHGLAQSQVCHGLAAHAARSADERIEIIAAVDARSDAQFHVALRLLGDIVRESDDAAIRELARTARHRIAEGLRLDAIEGEHLTGGIRPDLAHVDEASRDGAGVCATALGQRRNACGGAA